MGELELAVSPNNTELIKIQEDFKEKCRIQPFKFLLILDFEATCWENYEKIPGYIEIIEFPCVLYDVEKNSVVTHFQHYVSPIENPKLSNYCKNLTGITQEQVDKGVPLEVCMVLFNKWIDALKSKYHISFEPTSPNKCIFATWSDWDLGKCLKNECMEKQISLPGIFEKWIDLRALYKRHYMRRPKGLLGAIDKVGLKFEGRQHCGLNDAFNTAKLVGRMVSHGVILECTNDYLSYK